MENLLYVTVALSLSAIFYAYYLYKQVIKAPQGNERVVEIAGYIKE